MVAVDVRVFATSRAWVGGNVNRETKTILKRDSETLRNDGETEDWIGDGVKKSTCLGKGEREKPSRRALVPRVLNVLQ